MSDFKAIMHKNRFRLGLRSPDPLAGIKGPTFKGNGEKGERKGRRGRGRQKKRGD